MVALTLDKWLFCLVKNRLFPRPLLPPTSSIIIHCDEFFVGSSQGTFKILPKSPINIRSPQKFQVGSTIRTSDGKTIIIGSPQKQQQQIIIRPAASKENVTQQIIRIPASKGLEGSSEMQPGSKVQYVRVITTQSVKFLTL